MPSPDPPSSDLLLNRAEEAPDGVITQAANHIHDIASNLTL
ncbi:MAG: hypothetical protein WCN98_17680 [Verrucomicrobiaceae bacterium]